MAGESITRLWADLPLVEHAFYDQAELATRQRTVALKMQGVLQASGCLVIGNEGYFGPTPTILSNADKGIRFIQATKLVKITETMGIGLRNALPESRPNEIELVSGDLSTENAFSPGIKVVAVSDGTDVTLSNCDHAVPRHLDIIESFVDHIENQSTAFENTIVQAPKLPKVMEPTAIPAGIVINLLEPGNNLVANYLA
jgi:hypothetical protein